MKRRHVQMKESASASGLRLRRKLPTKDTIGGNQASLSDLDELKPTAEPKHNRNISVTACHRQLAASLGLPGRVDEGRAVVRRLLELVPDFAIARARGHIEFDMRTLPAEPPRH
jgi:hypothetical protein